MSVHELIAKSDRVLAVVTQRGVHRDHLASPGHAFENEAVDLFSVKTQRESRTQHWGFRYPRRQQDRDPTGGRHLARATPPMDQDGVNCHASVGGLRLLEQAVFLQRPTPKNACPDVDAGYRS